MSNSIRASLAGIVVTLMCVSPATAQPARSGPVSKWSVEIHGGFASGVGRASGDGLSQFPTGPAIATGGGGRGGLTSSRAVSSWFFGDGAQLVNDVNAGFGVTARISPLDAALRQNVAERGTGGSFGARLSRRMTSRLSAEVSVDYSLAPLRISDEANAAIGGTVASFIPAWQGLLATGMTSNRTVTSSVDVHGGTNKQIFLSGALTVDLVRAGLVRPYVTAGGGLVSSRGAPPSAVLTGHYRFDFASQFPIDETDVLTIHTTADRRAFLGIVGGGISCGTMRRGVRLDARAHLSRDTTATWVHAQPETLVLTPAFVIPTGGNPSVQFSNNPSTGRVSSLSGQEVDLKTFTTTGWQRQLNISVGYYVRF